MSTDAFISHVAGHAGISAERAERVTRSVLSGLGAWLTPTTRQLVADELPAPLAAALLDVATVALPVEERLLEPGITAGRAHELMTSVCRVLAEELSTDALVALRSAAPISIAPCLAMPAPEVATSAPEPRCYDTLATGRPGSRHPISDTPPATRQTGSVVDPNPHGATKLSSSCGTTQERRGEKFAEGRPGQARSLSGSRR